VSGATSTEHPSDSAIALHGRELQALRGVTLDDPLRALQSLPSVTATDDFYAEFAVRGSPFSQVNLLVDGMPSQYLMHSVFRCHRWRIHRHDQHRCGWQRVVVPWELPAARGPAPRSSRSISTCAKATAIAFTSEWASAARARPCSPQDR